MENSFILHRLSVVDNELRIAIMARGEYNSLVKEPQMTLIFSNGIQERILPLLICYNTESEGEFRILGAYRYKLEYLFYNQPVNKLISVRAEFRYGDKREKICFQVEMNNDVVSSILEDSGVFSGDSISYGKTIEYNVDYTKSGELFSGIELTAKKGQDIHVNNMASIKVVRCITRTLWCFILLVVSFILIPVFFVDGVMALAGLQVRNKKITGRGIIYVLKHIKMRILRFTNIEVGFSSAKFLAMKISYYVAWIFPIKQKRVFLLSNRRNTLTGNLEFVNNRLSEDSTLDIKIVLDDREVKHMPLKTLTKIGWYMASSKIMMIDDFSLLFYKLPRRPGTKLIQLWHACGAFKTFGCSRMGKKGGQVQSSTNHRNYDYAIVSSSEIINCYAEGFGISPEKVIATGIPRTDIFFDEDYKNNIQNKFYEKYPQLADKKILLFAPTFRGNGKQTGHYPDEMMDVNRFYEDIYKDYAIIVKHHPFVKSKVQINPYYADMIIDMSEDEEINDLLFVTDVLVTDYSSVVFEASLLKIPTIFYAFDLDSYISSRGFYFEYNQMTSGTIVRHYQGLVDAVNDWDVDDSKLDSFRKRFFDHFDGRSTERVVELVYDCMSSQR